MSTIEALHRKISDNSDLLREVLDKAIDGIVITTPLLKDNPIIYASSGFIKLTRYNEDEIIGQNCRFLQGPETDQDTVSIIRRSINDGIGFKGILINYKKGGESFENYLTIEPLINEEGAIEYFIGSQLNLTFLRSI